jgi:hypothetical protein
MPDECDAECIHEFSMARVPFDPSLDETNALIAKVLLTE